MKIIYFGSDVFLDVFRYFLENHEILALYTYHNDEDYFNENKIIHIARQNGIAIHYEQISEEDLTRYIEQDGVSLFFVAEYSHKLPIPHNPMFRGINLHSSLLPEGRSYYPIECAMERGLDYGGVTAHKLSSDLDMGDILANRSFPLTAQDDSIDAYIYSANAARTIVEEIFADFENCWKRGITQEKKLPYWKRPDTAVLTLRHDMTLEQARETYRKFNKMTMVELDGKLYYVDGFSTGNAKIGEQKIIFVRENRLLYSVTGGHLRLDIEAVPTS
ncbi:MAG: formyltransferase family protein [Oscillospiraceae bacterium]